MNHGYLIGNEIKYSGVDRFETRQYSSVLDIRREIEIGNRTYHFDGYRSSLIKWLVDHGDRRIKVPTSYRPSADARPTVMVRIDKMTAGGSAALVGHIQSGVARGLAYTSLLDTSIQGAKGALATFKSIGGAGLDGLTIANRNQSVDAIANGAGAGRGGPLAGTFDKLLNHRVRVTVGCDLNTQYTAAKVIDTLHDSVTCSAIADLLTGS